MFKGFTRGIAVFVAAIVLATGSPALAQSSGLLASAERAVLTMEAEQDETVVRRRRSGGLAFTGGALAAAGVVLALRPPVCELDGLGARRIDAAGPGVRTRTYDYEAVHRYGKCDVRMARTTSWWDGSSSTSVNNYYSNGYGGEALYSDGFVGDAPVTNKTWNYVGWATAATGGALMWFGLRGVDVPVRLDVAPTGRFRVAGSLGW